MKMMWMHTMELRNEPSMSTQCSRRGLKTLSILVGQVSLGDPNKKSIIEPTMLINEVNHCNF